jgi:hypothetical protein
MPRKKKTVNPQTANTAVTNPSAIFNNITLPAPSGEDKKGPKIETCEVGMFRLPGVKLDLEQFTEDQINEMRSWAKDNGAYTDPGNGLFSWKDPAKRDWFILKWS